MEDRGISGHICKPEDGDSRKPECVRPDNDGVERTVIGTACVGFGRTI